MIKQIALFCSLLLIFSPGALALVDESQEFVYQAESSARALAICRAIGNYLEPGLLPELGVREDGLTYKCTYREIPLEDKLLRLQRQSA